MKRVMNRLRDIFFDCYYTLVEDNISQKNKKNLTIKEMVRISRIH